MLEQLKADLAEAARSVWVAKINPSSGMWSVWGLYNTALEHCLAEGLREENARLIANLHNAAPALIEAVEALEEVLRISDRKHDAWDRAYAALAKLKGETK